RAGTRPCALRVGARFDPRTPADSVAALVATVRLYEGVVRERPSQWLMFEDAWGEPPARLEEGAPGYEMGPQASGLRRREPCTLASATSTASDSSRGERA